VRLQARPQFRRGLGGGRQPLHPNILSEALGNPRCRRICVYSRPYKEVRVQRKYPTGVGYQRDLYTVTNADAAVATYLERQFFKVTDDLAAKALSVIEAGPWKSMDTTTRSGWTRFIMSLLHRNPEQVGKFLEIVSQYVAIVKPEYEKLYYEKKDDDHPATFDEFWQGILPEVVGRTWIKLIQTTIDSKSVGEHFNSLIMASYRLQVVAYASDR
jgi:hypothetical protein